MGVILRALGRGRHTPRQADYAATGLAVFDEQHLAVTARVRDFRIPGQFAHGKSVLLSGSVLLTPEIVSASLGSRLLLAWLPWADVPDDAHGAVELRADGLHVTFQVGRIVPEGRGEVAFHYRFAPSADVVDALGGTTAPVRIEAPAFADLCWTYLGS